MLRAGLWIGENPILKARLFGLTGSQGNHGQAVKELYYYLDATPTGWYLKAMHRYPQAAYPYTGLVEENARRATSCPSSRAGTPGRRGAAGDGY